MTETVTIEKQVWESTLHRSMVLQAENEQLKELLKECREMTKNGIFIPTDAFISKIKQVLGEE